MRPHATYCALGLLILMSVLRSPAQAQGTPIPSPAAVGQASPPAEQKSHRLRFPIGIDRVPEEAREKMPLPFGIGMNFFGSREEYLFSSASVSMNGQPIPPQMMILDSLTVIQRSRTLRLDCWLLPFMNVYAINGTFSGKARDIKASMVGQSIPLPEEIPFRGTNTGMGVTLAAGYKSMFFTYDWNTSWAKLNLASGRVPTITQGPRIGVVFERPNVRADVYVGGFKENVSGNTEGSIAFTGIGLFDYDVTVRPESAWNYVLGADVELQKQLQISYEHGFGKRTHNMLSVTGRS